METNYKLMIKVGYTKSNGVYQGLVLDVGYRTIPLTFNRQDIAELLCMPVVDFVAKYPVRAGERASLYDLNAPVVLNLAK